MNPRISIVTLGVSDLERATTFYRDGLGLPADTSFPGVTFLKLQGTWLSLFPRSDLGADAKQPATFDAPGFRGFTLAHNVATQDEVHQVLEQAVAAGAVALKEPQATEWGGYHTYFADPDGFVWEIAWNPHFDLV